MNTTKHKRKFLSYDELNKLLDEAQSKVSEGSVWRHFKGGDYKVLGVVFDAEDLQLEVIHAPVEQPGVIFTRSMTNWLETVEFEGYTLSRFEQIES